MTDDIKDTLAKQKHIEAHELVTVYAMLMKIEKAASAMLQDAAWHKAVDIKVDVFNAKQALDNAVEKIIAFIKERNDVCKDCKKR